MKLSLQHRHHQPSESFTALIHTEFESLRTQLRIDEARVLVEHQPDASPPFRISAHLVTPGPDVMAEAKDHTLRAALGKLIRAIGDKISHRSRRKQRRHRSHVSGRSLPSPA
jgi:ribosome-associated translation inhibitor RaiA